MGWKARMRRGLIGSPGELAAEHCAAHHHMCAGCARHPRIEGGMQGFTRQAQRWHGPQAVCADTRAEGKAGTLPHTSSVGGGHGGRDTAACSVEEGPLCGGKCEERNRRLRRRRWRRPTTDAGGGEGYEDK